MCGNLLPSELEDQNSNSEPTSSPHIQSPDSNLELRPTPDGIAGERRVATVILADVKRSTDLLEVVGTEAWVGIMNRVFQLMNSEIYRFGGHVDQFRGDGLVAFFGTVVAHEDDPERGVLASLAMQQAIKDFATNLIEERGIEIKLRVGVNTGEVIVANIGSMNQHQEETAMGEAIAVAARMETAAEPGTVLVSENTYRLVENRFHWQPLGELPLKGFSKPVSVFRPLSPRFDFEAALDLQAYGMPVRMTGREAEFNLIKDVISDLYKGRGGIILLSGEKGLGKSLLVTQVRQHFSREEKLLSKLIEDLNQTSLNPDVPNRSSITWLKGTCRSYDQSWPFSMWVDLIYQWLGIRPDEPANERASHLSTKVQILWGDSANRYYPYLARFLSIPLKGEDENRIRRLEAESLKKQFYLTIHLWVETLARIDPLVLSFTDLQWADSASLNLLEYCMPICEKQSVVWLAVYRPDRSSPAWEFQHLVETEYPHRLTYIDLHPLEESETHELILQMVGENALSQKTEHLIKSKSEGNPYFIREMISSLISQDVLVQDPVSCEWSEARTISTLDLPDSLQSLLLERLDRLSVEERRLLQAASVMGLTFWYDILKILVNNSEQLETDLTSLQRKGLIQENIRLPGLGMEYGFISSLVRDVVYDSMLTQQRLVYHQKVAIFLEESDRLDNWLAYNSLIAFHYRNAGNEGQELFYTMKAAEQARSVYAMTEALDHLNRAYELLLTIESNLSGDVDPNVVSTYKFEVLSERNKVNFQLGRYIEAELDARALIPLANDLIDDPYWRVDALLRQPEVNAPETEKMIEIGLTMTKEALEISHKLGDRHRELQSLIQTTSLQFLIHDPGWKANSEFALQLARELDDLASQVNILLGIGSAYGLDELETSRKYLEMAIPLCQELADKATDMKLLRAFAEQYERSGDYYRQLIDFDQKRLQISREIGNRMTEGDALMYCGQIQGIYLGDLENGLEFIKESVGILQGTPGSLFPLLRTAQLQIELGQFSEASKTLEISAPFAEHNIFDLSRAGYALVSAILNNHTVDEEHLRAVVDLNEKIEKLVNEKLVSRQYLMASASEVSAAYLRLAVLSPNEAERQDFRNKALTASTLSLEIYSQFGFVQIVECSSECILYRHSQSLKANGYRENAKEFLDRSYNEMMRKHDLIPAYSPFRKTFLYRIKIHQQIREDFFLTAAEAVEPATETT